MGCDSRRVRSDERFLCVRVGDPDAILDEVEEFFGVCHNAWPYRVLAACFSSTLSVLRRKRPGWVTAAGSDLLKRFYFNGLPRPLLS
jgi:hypothetical protein